MRLSACSVQRATARMARLVAGENTFIIALQTLLQQASGRASGRSPQVPLVRRERHVAVSLAEGQQRLFGSGDRAGTSYRQDSLRSRAAYRAIRHPA